MPGKTLKMLVAALAVLPAFAQQLSGTSPLRDSTLRVDYIFSGTDKSCELSLDELRVTAGWHGRRVNMDKAPLKGNGQVIMADKADGRILYRQSFSTLFQEWQTTEEATRVRKSFENVFLLPMPSSPVDIRVELYDFHGNVSGSLTHTVDPSDILIRPAGTSVPEHRYLTRGTYDGDKIDVVIVGEGYTASEKETFYADATATVEALSGHEPFGPMMDRFNFIAVPLQSVDSGVSIPGKGFWARTPLSSSFDTFYMARYLTTLHQKDLHDALAGIPYEHIIILANTDNYGGGGIFNLYTLTTAHNKHFRPVVVHEFGHSFAGLADEYHYDDQFVEYYYPQTEPWERNITTNKDFPSKWKDMIDAGVPGVGLVEGGGYQSKGVWRASEDCRMKTNAAEGFCPVCRRAISDMIRFYTETKD